MTSASACRDIAPRLSAYLDHEASPEDMARVDAHLAVCGACRAWLQRATSAVPELEGDLRALMTHGETAARQMRPQGVLTRPDRLHEAPSSPFGRLASVMVVILVALVGALLVGRGLSLPPLVPPAQQPAAAPSSAPPTLVATLDGILDPAVAAYVRRVAAEAEAQGASGLVLDVRSTTALDTALQDVRQTLRSSTLATRVVAGSAESADIVAQLAPSAASAGAPPDDVASQPVPMTLSEALWHRLLDPTTVYVLLVLGLLALSVELAHPGALAPGAAGVLCLALAAVPLTTLPTNWLAVALLVVGVGLMALEPHVGGHGLLLLAGVLTLLVGSAWIFSPLTTLQPWLAPVSVPPAALALGIASAVSIGAVLARLARHTPALPATPPSERLLGARGEARSQLDPHGVVQVNGQLWSARALGAPLAAGAAVRVVARRGLILDVESAAYRSAATQKGAL